MKLRKILLGTSSNQILAICAAFSLLLSIYAVLVSRDALEHSKLKDRPYLYPESVTIKYAESELEKGDFRYHLTLTNQGSAVADKIAISNANQVKGFPDYKSLDSDVKQKSPDELVTLAPQRQHTFDFDFRSERTVIRPNSIFEGDYILVAVRFLDSSTNRYQIQHFCFDNDPGLQRLRPRPCNEYASWSARLLNWITGGNEEVYVE